MNVNGQILSKLIDEDYGLSLRSGSRYGKSNLHDSLVLDTERGIFFWNSKEIYGDPYIYLTKVRRMTHDAAKEYLKHCEYSGTFVYTIRSNQEDVIVYPELVDAFFEYGRDKRDYFYKRGFLDSTLDKFRCGWYNGFVTIPIFEGNAFRNFQLRKDDPKTIRPFYRGAGSLLFNSDILMVTNFVFITEGPTDAMIMMQNGLPAISCAGGNVMPPQWYYKFINQDKIYLLMDNDRAGEAEAKRMAKVLGETRCKIYCFWDFETPGYDPVDYFRDGHNVDSLLTLVKDKSKYSFEMEDNNRPRKVSR
jgi:DNA primase